MGRTPRELSEELIDILFRDGSREMVIMTMNYWQNDGIDEKLISTAIVLARSRLDMMMKTLERVVDDYN